MSYSLHRSVVVGKSPKRATCLSGPRSFDSIPFGRTTFENTPQIAPSTRGALRRRRMAGTLFRFASDTAFFRPRAMGGVNTPGRDQSAGSPSRHPLTPTQRGDQQTPKPEPADVTTPAPGSPARPRAPARTPQSSTRTSPTRKPQVRARWGRAARAARGRATGRC